MDISRQKPMDKNRVPEYVEQACIKIATENLALD
jgi:hypothetical protein